MVLIGRGFARPGCAPPAMAGPYFPASPASAMKSGASESSMSDSLRLRGSGDLSPSSPSPTCVPPCPRCMAPGYGFPGFLQLTLENTFAEWRMSQAPRRPPLSSLSSTAPTQALATPQVRSQAGLGREANPWDLPVGPREGARGLFHDIRTRGGALGGLWGHEGTKDRDKVDLAHLGPYDEDTVSDFVRKHQSRD